MKISANSQAWSGAPNRVAINGDAAMPTPATTADMIRFSVPAVRVRRVIPRSWSATTAAPTPRSRAASSIAIKVSAAVTRPKSSGVSNRASTRVRTKITTRLPPQARVVHRKPPTALLPRCPGSAAMASISVSSTGGSTAGSKSG